jgi:hypothetical protein
MFLWQWRLKNAKKITEDQREKIPYNNIVTIERQVPYSSGFHLLYRILEMR